MIMNSAKHMAASVHHLRLSSFRRMRSGIRLLSMARDDGGEGVRELAALRVGEGGHELRDSGDAKVCQAVDQDPGLVRGPQGLEATVLGVLAAGHEPAVDEGV